MKNRSLHELAKFAAGLIAADFFWLVWFSQQHVYKTTFFGSTVTQDMVMPALIFDVAVFLILVHYAWNVGRIPQVRERAYMLFVGVVFAVIAAAHVWRILTSSSLVIAGYAIPLWLSWIGIAITAYLAYASFHLAARIKR